MIKAKLIDVGRNKVNKTVEVKELEDLYSEVQKHLLSSDIEILCRQDEDPQSLKVGSKLLIIVGAVRPVGQIEILSL